MIYWDISHKQACCSQTAELFLINETEEIDNVLYITSCPPSHRRLLPVGVTALSFSLFVLSRLHLISSSRLFPSVPAGRWLSLDVLRKMESVGVSNVCSVSWSQKPEMIGDEPFPVLVVSEEL